MQATTPPSSPGSSLLRYRRLQTRWGAQQIDVRCAPHADKPLRTRHYLQCGNRLVALGVLGAMAAQAAERAGHTSAGNFATAFRRQFGLPPHRCRASR